mmetsp:Transcript_8481/g.24305  ORF Transcript_8481/g.24305 Transcript_8481/m.24305 type:complete len:587 (+) Transcript_8481:23-1783(+)|eukprot:CAMPEP_0117654972 /NCGR_PEP_ID=MMETSP0804-20121206/4032_1 /TAXON_ID=1074897 /ORGANISM="Tetraselmis astigmatica, Strain CCMP880" /LENGTH=586 /DNA_ID=CAMNT_0005461295 /DNA_START=107 /DNA_END=1867 /DNA_ORIENTATION=+
MSGARLQVRGGGTPGSQAWASSAAATNLEDYYNPTAEGAAWKRRGRGRQGAGTLQELLPSSWESHAPAVALGLLLLLVCSCVYALQVSFRIAHYHAELADPNAPLPSRTVAQLKRMAEDQVATTMRNAKTQLANELEAGVKEVLAAKIHEKTSDLVRRLQIRGVPNSSDLLAAGGSEEAGRSGTGSSGPSHSIPADLVLSGVKEWSEQQMRMSRTNSNPPRNTYYNGPLDLEDAITKRAKELNEAWEAMGRKPGMKPGLLINNWGNMPPWPFQRIQTAQHLDTSIILLAAPFMDEYYQGKAERGMFFRLLNTGHVMLGISSYEFFPAHISNPIETRHTDKIPGDKEIFSFVEGWLHCHRDPSAALPAGIPRALISESDFVNPFRNDGGGVMIPQGYEKEYDFLYVHQGGPWNDYNRNWTLARECLKKMADMGYKVVVLSKSVGSDKLLKDHVERGNIEVHQKELWRDFLKVIEKARALFIASVSDASPRIAAEALSFNVPLLMNYHIIGGWKYVNDKTGVLFQGADDVEGAIKKLRSDEFQAGLSPRQWFIDNWGPYNTSLRLHAFLEIILGKDRLMESVQLKPRQ